MRDLKTTPFGVLAYAVDKTKNVLTRRGKEELGSKYDKNEDAYRNYSEAIPITSTLDGGTLRMVDGIQAGQGPDAKQEDWHADGTMLRLYLHI
jgi:hypothetical protein